MFPAGSLAAEIESILDHVVHSVVDWDDRTVLPPAFTAREVKRNKNKKKSDKHACDDAKEKNKPSQKNE